jgi:hypothetical protein
MKFKLLAVAAVLAVSGAANAAVVDNGAGGNGGMLLNVWDAANSYSLNLGQTIDSFQSLLGQAAPLSLTYAADANFATFLSTADMANLQFSVIANDNSGARRVLESFSTLPATTIGNDIVRGVTTGNATYVNNVNAGLAASNSAVYAAGTLGYTANPLAFGKTNGTLNFSAAGSFSSALGLMRIDALASGIAKSIYTTEAQAGTNVSAYFAADNSFHLSAMPVAAVPEPETYAMLLAGLGLMGAIARRRNKKSA